MGKHTWKIIIGVVVLLIGASIVYSQHVAKQANEGVVVEEHVKGNPDAEVTLIEYSDFQCPACGQFYPYVKEVMEEYGDSIRFEYRHFPLTNIHPHAVPAARAAEAAGQQGMFWEMHDMLFENQPEWSNSTSPSAHFREYAEELGLDMELYDRHMNASIITNAIDESFAEARAEGFTGTPTFVLNGEEMQYDTFQSWREQIEAAIGVEGADEESTTVEGTTINMGSIEVDADESQ